MKTIIITVFVSILFITACKHDTCKSRCASVQVIDRNSGLEIRNAKVYFLWNEGGWNGWFQRKKFLAEATTDANGYASMYSDTAIQDGSIEVYAEAENYEPSTKGVFLDSRAGWTPEKITLNPYGYLKVHVVDTTRNDSNACVTISGRNYCNIGIDTSIYFKIPHSDGYILRYDTYKNGKWKEYENLVNIIGNDTVMIEIKF